MNESERQLETKDVSHLVHVNKFLPHLAIWFCSIAKKRIFINMYIYCNIQVT